jgi:hypothetical protein
MDPRRELNIDPGNYLDPTLGIIYQSAHKGPIYLLSS